MNSLVGYGVSSSSDEEEEDVNSRKGFLQDDATAAKKSRNFLLESGSASSESDSEDQEPSSYSSSSPHPQTLGSSAPSRPILPPPPLHSVTPKKLPPPSLNASSDSSVFTNPFKAQADQKLSALQKHVPLTMQARPSQIGGKKVCVSYRKDGRCRFGIKCKFAHDSDLQTAMIPNDSHPSVSEETPEPVGGSQSFQQESKEKEAEQQMKKRKVGLSNSLIPPKRALKQYTMQRDR
uniref:Si:ch211-113e8.11 n=1 Tax=Poecilia formosa TaxID=48698 RepID=A0A087XQ12_POEFO